MTISKCIDWLAGIQKKHGNLPINLAQLSDKKGFTANPIVGFVIKEQQGNEEKSIVLLDDYAYDIMGPFEDGSTIEKY